jgi:alpha/beta superfamily hydrolase
MAVQRVRFAAEGPEPPQLEGELGLPEVTGPTAGVVVAHPHPQRGGSMDSNVMVALCQGLHAAGIASLRFNFRGVGGSQGAYGSGEEERGDVRGALAFLAAQPGIAPERVGLAGYSFGARVCLATIVEAPQVRALLCVAPPLREPLPANTLDGIPYFVLVGDRDGNVAEGIERYASCLPDPTRLRVVPGTDHFWWGFESVLEEAARDFFSETLASPHNAVVR